jgi:hypothetical protein
MNTEATAAKWQLDILRGQNQVLDILHNFASKDRPGQQQRMMETTGKILAIVGIGAAAS